MAGFGTSPVGYLHFVRSPSHVIQLRILLSVVKDDEEPNSGPSCFYTLFFSTCYHTPHLKPFFLMSSRAPERYFPSITSVLTRAEHSFHIPVYRPSLCLRYKPYPPPPPPQNDRLMNTIDYRDSESAIGTSLPTIIEEDLEEIEDTDDDITISPESSPTRARRLSSLIMELVLAVRQNLASNSGKTSAVDAESKI